MQILRTSKWDMFVQINEVPYKELLLEFLAIFSFERHSVTFDKPNTVQFRLGDNCFQLSLSQSLVYIVAFTPLTSLLALSTSSASTTWAMPSLELFGIISVPQMLQPMI